MLAHAGGVGGGRVHQPGDRSMDKGESTHYSKRAQVPRRFWEGGASGTVKYHEGRGVVIRGLSMPRNSQSPDTIGGPRGKITGWTSASRRRFRRALIELEPSAGRDVACVGCTFTVPGPVLPASVYRELWVWFGKALDKARVGLIWRMEIQRRGALHWHGIAVGSASGSARWWGSHFQASEAFEWSPGKSAHFLSNRLRELWSAALDHLGAFTYEPAVPLSDASSEWAGDISRVPYADAPTVPLALQTERGRTSGVLATPTLSSWPGASERAYGGEVGADGWSGAWLRYLQDHASKLKQEQVAQAMGRHWGIAYRRGFRPRPADGSETLTERQYWRFVRCLQRLATPSRHASCVFGRRLGYRQRRGTVGESVWFTRPETVRKAVAWAKCSDAAHMAPPGRFRSPSSASR